jgi:predicted ABC-type ATPase
VKKAAPNRQKKIVIIAWPNGAGKTTFAREFLPREAACPDFICRQLDTL